jgi:hypothetical protein
MSNIALQHKGVEVTGAVGRAVERVCRMKNEPAAMRKLERFLRAARDLEKEADEQDHTSRTVALEQRDEAP